MSNLFWFRAIAQLLGIALIASPFALAQDVNQMTRPRRVAGPLPSVPDTSLPPAVEPSLTRLPGEPVIRIGLTTSARSVSISANGLLLSAAEGGGRDSAPLMAARVRVEPRLLAPLAPSNERAAEARVEIVSLPTRADAERAARDIREMTGEETSVTPDVADSWRVRVGGPRSYSDAESLSGRLEEAGFLTASIIKARDNEPATSASSFRGANGTRQSGRTAGGGGLQLVSRISAPARELIVTDASASSAAPLLHARAPVIFASNDEQNAPLRFNEKPYRGRLEVFANPGGALTVVNVVGLEDYVRGVVPNEMSAASASIEALKAQAVAARTYAVKNLGRFKGEGFDLLPTVRSQVYGGMATEHPLATRAVEETRGIIATYQGEPIDALYSSTCGGRTENVENVFGGDALPYLRARECAFEGTSGFAPFTIRTAREPATVRQAEHAASPRAIALLAVHNFKLPPRITDEWLAQPVTVEEVRALLQSAAQLARRPPPVVSGDVTRPPGLSTALALALDGESRADVLLNRADVDYLLAFRDADEIPASARADVALMVRDGHLKLDPDGTLRPRQAMTRARVIGMFASLLEARGLIALQKGTARQSTNGALVVRAVRGADRSLKVSDAAYLFRAFGDGLYPVRAVTVIGGEPISYHTDARGEVDYLEVRPAPNGASSDRASSFSNWVQELSAAEVRARLARAAARIGDLLDLRVAARGASRRVTDLEIVGSKGSTHLVGGGIRSALGLRDQLFVIDRRYDGAGQLAGFVFTGRGWGHGVGMCQFGAYGLARAGLTYDQILKAYYSGIELKKVY